MFHTSHEGSLVPVGSVQTAEQFSDAGNDEGSPKLKWLAPELERVRQVVQIHIRMLGEVFMISFNRCPQSFLGPRGQHDDNWIV